MKVGLSVLILLLFTTPFIFAGHQWKINRSDSRSSITFLQKDSHLSIALKYNGETEPLSAQWAFSSSRFRAGGISRNGFVSFFDNRNLSSEKKRNNISDTWSASRLSSLTGMAFFGPLGTGLYAARHSDYLITGGFHRWNFSEKISLMNACEWWGASTGNPNTDWYFPENRSRETMMFKSVHGIRYQNRNGHDAALYVSASSGNLNPAAAALMLIYEYKHSLREFLLKASWYGNGYLFKIQNPADRDAVFFASYRENFGENGYIRARIGFDLLPIPDLFYIIPFEIFTEIRGEYIFKGLKIFAENRLTLSSDQDGYGEIKNRTVATVSWQGMPIRGTAIGLKASVRCTAAASSAFVWKTEFKGLVIHHHQGFSVWFSAENGKHYICGTEMRFRLPRITVTLAPEWEWIDSHPTGGLNVSFEI